MVGLDDRCPVGRLYCWLLYIPDVCVVCLSITVLGINATPWGTSGQVLHST
jgi:hypothetical protein